MEKRIGCLAVGHEADIIALDLVSTPEIAQRAVRSDDIWQALFPTIMMGDDRAIKGRLGVRQANCILNAGWQTGIHSRGECRTAILSRHTIAGIPEARYDVAPFVEPLVKGCSHDRHLRVGGFHPLTPSGAASQAESPYVRGARVLESGYRGSCRVARCQHGIKDDDQPVLQFSRNLK